MTVIGEAFIEVKPDTDGFGPETEKSVVGSVTSIAKKAAVAIGAVFAVDKGVEFFKGAINQASDLSESASKVGVVFGEAQGSVLAFAEDAAKALGQSKQQALEATGTFGNLFRALKIGESQSAEMSTTLVQLASDLASFNNVDPAEALDALRSGLVGETEPLRKFGVNMNEAALQQKALTLGLVKGKEPLSAAAKAQAAYALILEQTTLAQGDFARTSGGLANQQRIASALWTDLQAKIGGLFLPAINKAMAFVTANAIPALSGLVDTLQKGLAVALERVTPLWEELSGGFRAFVEAFKAGDGDITSSGIPGFFERLGQLARDVWDQLAPIGGAFSGLADSLANLFSGGAGEAVTTLDGMPDDLGLIGDAVRTLAGLVSDVLTAALGGLSTILDGLSGHMDVVTAAVWAGVAAWGAYKGALITAQVWEGVTSAVTAFGGAMKVASLQTQLWGGSTLGNLAKNLLGIGGGATAAVGPVSELAGAAGGGGGLAGALGFLANPVTLIAAVIAALAAAAVFAYLKFQPFHDLVDAVGRTIRDAALWVWDLGKALFSWDLDKVTSMLSDLWNAFMRFNDQLAGWVGSAAGWLAEKAAGLAEALWGWVQEAVPAALAQLGEWLAQLGNWILTTAAPWLADKALQLGESLLSFIADAITQAPGRLGYLLGAITAWAINAAVALPGLLADLAEAVWGWIGPAVKAAPRKLWDLLWAVGEWYLTDFIPGMVKLYVQISEAVLGWVWEAIKAAPGVLWNLLKAFGDFLLHLPENLLTFITQTAPQLAQLAWGIVTGIWNGLISAAGWLIQRGIDFLTGFFEGLLDNLSPAAQSLITGIVDFFAELPGNIIEGLGDLGSLIWDWITGALGWLIDNGPALFAAYLEWWAGVPGMIWDALGDLGRFLWDNVYQPALQWVYDNTVGKVGELIDWFSGLPGRIREAVGDLFGFLGENMRNAVNAVIGFWNGLRIPQFDIGPWEIPTSPWTTQKVGPFTIGGIDFPDIPQLAQGGIVIKRPGGIVANLGEGAFNEAVMPLPPGMMEGLMALARGGGGSGDQRSIFGEGAIQVHGWETDPRMVAAETVGLIDWTLTTRFDQ